jgi:hypothetical protein
LNYDYYNSNFIGNSGLTLEQQSFMLRLKLTSVVQVGDNGTELPPHSFVYNETIPLPSRLSFDQDNWGFYNGLKNNPHLIPPFRIGTTLYPGANRQVDENYTSVGILKRINYPTGGYTQLEYENHVVSGLIPYAENQYLLNRNAYLDSTTPCIASTTNFCKNVTVNDYASSGVFMSINVEGILNCNQCAQGIPNPLSCAILSLESPTFTLPITCNLVNVYVPNGTYVLKANFANNPQQPNQK